MDGQGQLLRTPSGSFLGRMQTWRKSNWQKIPKAKSWSKTQNKQKQETQSAEEIKKHEEKTILNFTSNEVPVDFINISSKGLDYKTSTENIPKLDIITGIEVGH